jgi:hypothetical protein
MILWLGVTIKEQICSNWQDGLFDACPNGVFFLLDSLVKI